VRRLLPAEAAAVLLKRAGISKPVHISDPFVRDKARDSVTKLAIEARRAFHFNPRALGEE
jgi:hypothetical protein